MTANENPNAHNQHGTRLFMKTTIRSFAAIFLFVLTNIFAQFSSANTAEIRGKVVGISDGDTITVLDAHNVQHKVRLAGIDSPEKGQAFGNRAKENLSNLVYGKVVTVETKKKDRYGRAVGKVLVDGKDANLEQVKSGFAWHYKEYQREQSAEDRSLYASAENSAKSAGRGLWLDKAPVKPDAFRKASPAPTATSTCSCGSGRTCTGERGGIYCIAPNGKKKYG